MSISKRRRVIIAIISTAAVLAVAGTVNVVGVRILGDVGSWQAWLAQHAPHFFAWRLLLYGAIAYGWCRIRRAVIEGDADHDPVTRLRRVEIVAALSMFLLELSACRFFRG